MAHYPNAPIFEAAIDIQVRLPNAPPPDVFTGLAHELSKTFPTSTSINQFQLNIISNATGIGPVAQTPVHITGVRLTRPQNDRVLQIQPRGMTFSHLAPYTKWDTFRHEAGPLWNRYVEFVKPEAVTRVALRYINRIYIPHKIYELSDYFRLYPQIPEKIPQDITGFFMQFQMPQADLSKDAMAIINMAATPPREDGAQGVILDLDVFTACELKPSIKEIFDLLEIIRTRKNELFEACVTDKSRELFR
jgi:uncharacterized protein (TIGR04255 family)